HRSERLLLEAKRFPDAALDAVTLRCACGMLARHQEPQTWPARRTPLQEEGVTGHTASRAFAQQMFKLRFLTQAAGCIEPETLDARGYSPSRRRPLARRLRSTA